MPWYGNIKGFEVIPQEGSVGDNPPAGMILVLIESGQLFLFDGHLSPNPLSLALQELPQLTVSRLESSALAHDGPHAVNADTLQVRTDLGEPSEHFCGMVHLGEYYQSCIVLKRD